MKEIMLKEIRIKIVTYEGMFYTYAIINKDTDRVMDFNSLIAEIDVETEIVKPMNDEISLYTKLEEVTHWCLDDLANELESNKFIYCKPDNKIINVKEIKEVIINKY